MHFERVQWRRASDELAGTVGDDGVYEGARVRWGALSEEERVWVFEVLARAGAALGGDEEEGELVRAGDGYRCQGAGAWDALDDDVRARLSAELDDVLTAVHGLLVV